MEKKKEPVILIAAEPLKKTEVDTYTSKNLESNIKKSKTPISIGSTRG